MNFGGYSRTFCELLSWGTKLFCQNAFSGITFLSKSCTQRILYFVISLLFFVFAVCFIYFGSNFPFQIYGKFSKKRLVKKILSSIFKSGPHEEEVRNRRGSPDVLLFHNFRRLTLMRCCLAGNHSY